MILGMSTATFTALHVVLSLAGIVAGLVVVIGMFSSQRRPAWTAAFLGTTILTCITGFLFPFQQWLPSHVVGVLSLLLLAAALVALYVHRLTGKSRWIYVTCAVWAVYLNAFVAVVQAFLKIGFVNALAPTQTEPAFTIAQGVLLALFVAAFWRALRAFHPRPMTVVLGTT